LDRFYCERDGTDIYPMQNSTPSRPKSFTAYYAIGLALVALTSGAAVFANMAPERAASLTSHIDTQVALFLVPFAVLMFAIIAEVLYATFKGVTPAMAEKPVRSIRHWTPGHGEG
jgi:FtsH-binding integral membrane protein